VGTPVRARTTTLQTLSVVAIAPESGHTFSFLPSAPAPRAPGRRSLPAFVWERLRIWTIITASLFARLTTQIWESKVSISRL
jgi:hypothetical protein